MSKIVADYVYILIMQICKKLELYKVRGNQKRTKIECNFEKTKQKTQTDLINTKSCCIQVVWEAGKYQFSLFEIALKDFFLKVGN